MVQLLSELFCLTHLTVRKLRMTNLLYENASLSSLSRNDRLSSIKSLYLRDLIYRHETDPFNGKKLFRILSKVFPRITQLTIRPNDQVWKFKEQPIPDLKKSFKRYSSRFFKNSIQFRVCRFDENLLTIGRHA